MTNLDDRGKALENKYFHDEETLFKIVSRRRKMLGQWAAKRMGLIDNAADQYASEILEYGVLHSEAGAVISKILLDLQAKGVTVTEREVRDAMSSIHQECEAAVLEENNG